MGRFPTQNSRKAFDIYHKKKLINHGLKHETAKDT